MHAILATLGTDGDVFPYLGLGDALRGRGHRVTLASDPERSGEAAAHGFGFAPLIPAGEWETVLANPDMWHPLRSGRVMAAWGTQHIQSQFTTLAELMAERDTVLVA